MKDQFLFGLRRKLKSTTIIKKPSYSGRQIIFGEEKKINLIKLHQISAVQNELKVKDPTEWK
jgi:hypothetical protein